jgi:hypothetical protein
VWASLLVFVFSSQTACSFRLSPSIYRFKERPQNPLAPVPFNYEYFRESLSEFGTTDDELVKRIYRTCRIAHHWRCHTVQDGYFYKCPQSFFLPTKLGGSKLRVEDNGIKIEDTAEFGQRLLNYLESQAQLPACRYCLGSVGKLFQHEQVSRKHWAEYQQRRTEDLIDIEYLELLEHIEKIDPSGSSWEIRLRPAELARQRAAKLRRSTI